MNDLAVIQPNNKCIVYGCRNHKNEGMFVGEMCSPCYSMITTGKITHSDSFLNRITSLESENTRITYLESENEKLKSILRKIFPEKSGDFFICGEAGEKDTMGLPERILVCPAYGADGFVTYKKAGEYSAPGW